MEKPGLKHQESVSAFFKLFSRKLCNLTHLLPKALLVRKMKSIIRNHRRGEAS